MSEYEESSMLDDETIAAHVMEDDTPISQLIETEHVDESVLPSIEAIVEGSPLNFLGRYGFDEGDGEVVRIIADMTKEETDGYTKYRGLHASDMSELARRIGDEVGQEALVFYINLLLGRVEEGQYSSPRMVEVRHYRTAYDEGADRADYEDENAEARLKPGEDLYEGEYDADEESEEGEDDNEWIDLFNFANANTEHPRLRDLPPSEADWVAALSKYKKNVIIEYGVTRKALDTKKELTMLEDVLSHIFSMDILNLGVEERPTREFVERVAKEAVLTVPESTLLLLGKYRQEDREDTLIQAYFDSILNIPPEDAAKNPMYERVIAFLDAAIAWLDQADIEEGVAEMSI